MKIYRVCFLILLINVLNDGLLIADEIHLKNGDRISGDILSMKDNKLTLNTSYAGELGIKWSEVVSMKTDKEISVILNNGYLIRGMTQDAEEGRVRLSGDRTGQCEVIDIADVKAVDVMERLKIKARANMGINSIRGNSNQDATYFDGEVILRTAENRYTAGGNLNRTEDSGKTIENNSHGHLKYDYFISKKWFAYANTSFETDKLVDLNLRSLYGVGSGYQFLETPITNLYIEAGINYVTEDYMTISDENFISGRWAVSYDRYFHNRNFQFFHFHEGYGSFEDTNDWFIKSKTGLRIPLFTGFNASLQLNLDWDNDPPPGKKRFDRALMFTLGYKFEQ